VEYFSIPSMIERLLSWIKKGNSLLKQRAEHRYRRRYARGMQLLGANRRSLGEALLAFYSAGETPTTPVHSVRYIYPTGEALDLPLVTRREYVRHTAPSLGFSFAYSGEAKAFEIDAKALAQAQARWLAAGLRLWGGPVFSLQSVELEPPTASLEFRTVEFFTYRASYGEVFDELGLALADKGLTSTLDDLRTRRLHLFPLRERYMPDLRRVMALEKRICAGGPIVLIAARTEDNDLAFIIQRRSDQVSDEPLALTPVPRAFHGPEVDASVEYDMTLVVLREMWEELFGGEDRPSGELSALHFIDKCPAVRELFDGRDTNHVLAPLGLMWDLYRGNFIASYCLHITDPTWWTRHSRAMKLNWEFDVIRKNTPVFASRGGLATLLDARDWALDSYFAFIEGVRWLAPREELVSRLSSELPRLVLSRI